MTPKTYVILGGGGSFGLHTAKYLLEHSNARWVLCIGRSRWPAEAFCLGLGLGSTKYTNFHYRQMHLLDDFDLLVEFLKTAKPNIIINFAAQGEGAVSWTNSWRFFDTNATGLARLTEALLGEPWLERFIQIGTSELYGSVECPANEDFPIKPSSPYSASKAAFDLHLMAISQTLKFPMNIIRPCNCYGPGQLLHRIVPRTIVKALKGEKLQLHGGGQARKTYMHSADLARAVHTVAEKAPLGEVYNAGPSGPTSIKSLVATILQRMGCVWKDVVEEADERPGQDGCYWLDSSRIRQRLGWEPKIAIEDGIDDTVKWVHAHWGVLKDWPMEYRFRP